MFESPGEYNVYYNPEKFGLTVVFDTDIADSYEFDMLVVWKDEAGKLYYSTDSGCSCPVPFEGLNGIEDLQQITLASLESFEQEAAEHLDAADLQEIRGLLKEVKHD